MGNSSPSKLKYKEAVKKAEEDAYRDRAMNPPSHFDERQIRIYQDKYRMFANKAAYGKSLAEDMALLHGYKYNEQGKLVRITK
ncbi:TPA: hypothetical protein ACPVZG_000442 [Vibrio parahaemolyticus]